MMANTVDMQQLLMSIDPGNNAQEQFNQMMKGGGMLTSGGSASPSSLASSGAPSAASDSHEEKEQNASAWLNLLMQQQQQQQQQQNSNKLVEMMKNTNPQLLEILAAQSGSSAADLTQMIAQMAGSHDSFSMPDEDAENNATPMVPTTSSADTQTSVIVNGCDDPSDSQPAAKKSKVQTDSDTNSSSANNSLMKAAFDNLLLAQMSSLTSQVPMQQQQKNEENIEESNNTTTNTVYKCTECDKEFDGLAYLEQHKITQHPNLMTQRLFSGLFPQSMASLPLMFQSPLHQQFSAAMQDFDSPLSSIGTPNKMGAVKRQYSSNGKNYCDLCNKEVCNKYFLRTHMLKMHGIVIDENKTVIANIDTLERERVGGLTFRCDTCMTEFKSRNLLRQHKQDVHGVLPLSTPRSNSTNNKPPSTPTSTSSEEKCQLCDKRVPSVMMAIHVQQEHLGNGTPDLTQVMALLNQATRGQSSDSVDENASVHHKSSTCSNGADLLKCGKCQYVTRDARNLEMHNERHESMDDAKRSGEGEDEDEALKLTTEAALKMVVQNQFENEGDAAVAAALNLSIQKQAKKDGEEEKASSHNQHERNSHTSGSISPSGESLPEGFGKAIGNDKYPLQTFIIRSNDSKGSFLGEFMAQLPVKSMVDGPRQIVFELMPTSNSVLN